MSQTKLGSDKTVYQEKCHFCDQELKDPDHILGASEVEYPVCENHQGFKQILYLSFRPFPFILSLFLVVPMVLIAEVLGVKELLEEA